jgi:phosphatidylglycerophosphate synthase
MANGITALRVLLTVPLLLIVSGAPGALLAWLAALLFAIIAASDVIDGRVARAAGTASNRGRTFDHGADIFFILGTLGTYAWIGTIPWWVPASIALAFTLYVLDARSAAAPTDMRRLAGRIGHVGGVCNYVVIGVLIGNETIGLHLLPPVLIRLILLAVPVYSLAAAVVRRIPASASSRSTLSIR